MSSASKSSGLLAACWALMVCASAAPALDVGQLDDFENGTILNWVNGSSAADPLNIASGGPAGAGDNFLQVTADGNGAGGKLVTFNQKQWLGNYLAAGITGIELDLKNLGATPLAIRLVMKTGGGSVAGYTSKAPVDLPADNQWHHAFLALDAASLVRINSSTLSLDALLAKPGELRIVHSTTAKNSGDQLTSKLGIDNIRAVPEPAGGMLALAAVLGFALVSRRSWAGR